MSNPISSAEASTKHGGHRHHHKHSYHHGKHRHHPASAHPYGDKSGMASWYGHQFHGRKTANGERYDMYAMTAAHNTLPLSSYAEVTNLRNQRTVIVRINDRGPFRSHRVMDLSYAAAKELGIQRSGTASIKITPLAMN